ncbi:hypothetical protein A0O00_11200 [Proteus mirabilis]|nr:hypothetical protein A0O00_11200 [Proteus mirabilis]
MISTSTGLTIDSDELLFRTFPDFKKIINAFGIDSSSQFDKIIPNELGNIIAENFINAQGGYN